VELAAVVIAPDERDFASFQPPPSLPVGVSRPFYSPLLPILGNDVRRMWTDRVHRLGVQSFWLDSVAHDKRKPFSELCRLAKEGVERILMIKLKFYAEMDLADILRFHCQSQNSMTEVHDSHGRLGVSVLDRPVVLAAARKGESFPMRTVFEPVTYPFTGYAKRILSPKERQELVGDALAGACALRPVGTEIRERVWLGDGVSLAGSAKVLGSTYIGDRVIVLAGATVGPFASVERDCMVDCGTTLERSTVLPGTYLAAGLLIRKALVDGGQMEDVRSGTVVDLEQCGLARRVPGHERTPTRSGSASNASPPNHSWFAPSSSTERRKLHL
jgi:carbonic anhydrase/acetyltransferase-like protein (isoleucine patch superfamily)